MRTPCKGLTRRRRSGEGGPVPSFFVTRHVGPWVTVEPGRTGDLEDPTVDDPCREGLLYKDDESEGPVLRTERIKKKDSFGLG